MGCARRAWAPSDNNTTRGTVWVQGGGGRNAAWCRAMPRVRRGGRIAMRPYKNTERGRRGYGCANGLAALRNAIANVNVQAREMEFVANRWVTGCVGLSVCGWRE